MAERERQHYVPQFLLRNFASIEGKNVVNLYNKKHGKKAFNVSITTQAQEKFYYGEDPAFELFFAHVENRIAPDIAKIIEQEKIPELGEKFYAGLVHFIATFAFRTKANVDRVEEGINAAFKEVSKYIDELKDIDWDTHRLKHPEPAAHSVAYYFHTWPVLGDLEMFLLINETSEDFIISDNPLVVFNPMMQRREEYAIAQGLINKGILLLFPISPRHCLMLIDPWAYDVFCSGSNCWIDNIDDIRTINLLQTISAAENVFFADANHSIEAICETAAEHKIDKPINQVIDHPQKPGVKLLLNYHLMHKINPPLSFIREGQEALLYDCSQHDKHVRHQELINIIETNKENMRQKYGQ